MLQLIFYTAYRHCHSVHFKYIHEVLNILLYGPIWWHDHASTCVAIFSRKIFASLVTQILLFSLKILKGFLRFLNRYKYPAFQTLMFAPYVMLRYLPQTHKGNTHKHSLQSTFINYNAQDTLCQIMIRWVYCYCDTLNTGHKLLRKVGKRYSGRNTHISGRLSGHTQICTVSELILTTVNSRNCGEKFAHFKSVVNVRMRFVV